LKISLFVLKIKMVKLLGRKLDEDISGYIQNDGVT
jgi:hypothetical protein